MSTIAGYKAVLLATEHLDKMFPLLMTAAGTITPATVLVLGAGNELFYEKQTMMVFGDAKATLTSLVQLLKKTAVVQVD